MLCPLKASALTKHGGTLTSSTLTHSPTHSLAAISACKNIQPLRLTSQIARRSAVDWGIASEMGRHQPRKVQRWRWIAVGLLGVAVECRPARSRSDASGQKRRTSSPWRSGGGKTKKDSSRSSTTGKRRSWHKLSPNSQGALGLEICRQLYWHRLWAWTAEGGHHPKPLQCWEGKYMWL